MARLVAEGARVRVLDDCSSGRPDNLPPRRGLIVADVADPEAACRVAHGVEAMFHFAAIPSVAAQVRMRFVPAGSMRWERWRFWMQLREKSPPPIRRSLSSMRVRRR